MATIEIKRNIYGAVDRMSPEDSDCPILDTFAQQDDVYLLEHVIDKKTGKTICILRSKIR